MGKIVFGLLAVVTCLLTTERLLVSGDFTDLHMAGAGTDPFVESTENETVSDTSDDGRVIVTSEDGTTMILSENGTVIVTSDDGTASDTSDDGTATGTSDDGTASDTSDDGTAGGSITIKGTEVNGTCCCTISGDWSIMTEYNDLQRIKVQIEEMQDKLEEHDTNYILREMEKLMTRVDALEKSLYSQTVAVSTREFVCIQKSLYILTDLVNQLNVSDTNGIEIIKMVEELSELSVKVEDMWQRNPYATEDDLLKEIGQLQDRLATWHQGLNFTYFRGDILPLLPDNDGFCEGREVAGISDALTHKWENYYPYGNWFKDPLPQKLENRTQIWYRTESSHTYFYRFDNYNDFISDREKFTGPGDYASGLGNLIYNGSFYYPYGYKINKYMLVSGAKQSIEIVHSNVEYNQQNMGTFIDLHADEMGLWAIYATEDNADKIVISLLDPVTMQIRHTWRTNKIKSSVCAAFMVCGKMYTVDNCRFRLSLGANVNQYVYDTNTGKDYYIPYHVTVKYTQLSHLTYNPRERLLFGWDNGHMVTYQIFWMDGEE